MREDRPQIRRLASRRRNGTFWRSDVARFVEQVSSVGTRRQLEAALDYAREGDTLVVTKLDRLARSVTDLLNIVGRLKKVDLRVLSMSGTRTLDTSTAVGKLMLAVIGAVGQFEREMMLKRQREGIAKAKAQGALQRPCADSTAAGDRNSAQVRRRQALWDRP